jgi:hypothetical protein
MHVCPFSCFFSFFSPLSSNFFSLFSFSFSFSSFVYFSLLLSFISFYSRCFVLFLEIDSSFDRVFSRLRIFWTVKKQPRLQKRRTTNGGPADLEIEDSLMKFQFLFYLCHCLIEESWRLPRRPSVQCWMRRIWKKTTRVRRDENYWRSSLSMRALCLDWEQRTIEHYDDSCIMRRWINFSDIIFIQVSRSLFSCVLSCEYKIKLKFCKDRNENCIAYVPYTTPQSH